MKTDTPLVTIGLPTYNRASWLRKSLASCLAQSYSNIEIIVSDNASQDETPQVVNSFSDQRIRYLHQMQGVSMLENWNACWQNAKGGYMTYLSDDDILCPMYVESLINLAQKYPDMSLWRCGVQGIDIFDQPLWEFNDYPEVESPEQFLTIRIKENRVQLLPGFLFRKVDMEKVGGFVDTKFPGALYSDDYLWFRLAFLAKGVASINRVLWSYRQHSQHAGSGIDMSKFVTVMPDYIMMLTELVRDVNLSSEFKNYISSGYGPLLVSQRLKMVARWQREESVFGYVRRLPEFLGASLFPKVKVSQLALLRGIFEQNYLDML